MLADFAHASGHAARRRLLDRPAVRFVAHALEMVVAMVVGMALLEVPVGAGLAALGISNIQGNAPELATLLMAVEMAIPMALWMRFRGHRGRLVAEMTGAMLVPAVGLVVAAGLGLLSGADVMGWYHPAMYAAMALAMVVRRADYAGAMGHGDAAAEAPAREERAAPAGEDRVAGPRADRWALRVGALAGLIGLPLQIVVSSLHPGAHDPNDSAAVFLDYAASPDWTAIHIGQFFGTLLITLGLLAVARSLLRQGGLGGALAQVSAVALGLVVAIFAVQMAVDGVVLREAIRAWVEATGTAREATTFDIAETVRWLEKGLSGFFHLANGTALLTLGLSIGISGGYHRLFGIAGILAGLGFLSGGYATAHTGFSAEAGSVLTTVLLPLVLFVLATSIAMGRRSGGSR